MRHVRSGLTQSREEPFPERPLVAVKRAPPAFYKEPVRGINTLGV